MTIAIAATPTSTDHKAHPGTVLYPLALVNAVAIQWLDVLVDDTEALKPSLAILLGLYFWRVATSGLRPEVWKRVWWIGSLQAALLVGLVVSPSSGDSFRAFASLEFRILFLLATFLYVSSGAPLDRIAQILRWIAAVCIGMTAVWWYADRASGELLFNFENQGSAILMAIAPLLGYQRRRLFFLLTIVAVAVLGSRMGTALLVLMVAVPFVNRGRVARDNSASFSLALGLVGSALALFLFAFSSLGRSVMAYVPSELPARVPHTDWRRITANFFSMESLREDWLSGIGVGRFRVEFLDRYGLESQPHGFIHTFWVELGLLGIGSWVSVTVLAARSAFTGRAGSATVLFVAHVTNTLYFITRPQQGNFLYFMIIGMALAIPFMTEEQDAALAR